MKKLFLLAFLLLIVFAPLAQSAEVLKGTMVMVYSKKPISTEFYQENDFVYFINPVDVFQGEENIFPKNSIFIGYVNFLKLPVQGVNGAIGIKITEVIFPNGKKQKINATIHHQGEAKIGGSLTPPASYNKSIHYWKGWQRGAIQLVPSGEYEFGKHTTIPVNEGLFVVFDENINLMGQ